MAVLGIYCPHHAYLHLCPQSPITTLLLPFIIVFFPSAALPLPTCAPSHSSQHLHVWGWTSFDLTPPTPPVFPNRIIVTNCLNALKSLESPFYPLPPVSCLLSLLTFSCYTEPFWENSKNSFPHAIYVPFIILLSQTLNQKGCVSNILTRSERDKYVC